MILHLVSLDCPSCGSALQGEGLDTIFFCDHCGDAATLDEDGLHMVESSALLPSPGRSAREWRPAWLLEADVRVSDRVRAKGRRSEGLSHLARVCRTNPALARHINNDDLRRSVEDAVAAYRRH